VVLYGGNNNWFAAYAYWYLKYYGHQPVRLMDGGRKKWELEQRPGHIPGARNIPWVKAVDPETGAFLPTEQLRSLYEGQGVTPDLDVVAYCRIGERSAHTWFALHELLGYPRVRNYDGSWTEWGSMVGVPIER